MTNVIALAIPTALRLVAELFAAENGATTMNIFCDFSTVTSHLDTKLARLASTVVANLFTVVKPTVENFSTNIVTRLLRIRSAARVRVDALPARADVLERWRSANRARAWMTRRVTLMGATVTTRFATHIAARVGSDVRV